MSEHGTITWSVQPLGRSHSLPVCDACADVIGGERSALVGGRGRCNGWALADWYRSLGYDRREAEQNMTANGHDWTLLDWDAGPPRSPSDVQPDDLLDSREIAIMLSVSPSAFTSMRSQPGRHRKIDGMPAPLRTIGNAPVWSRAEVEGWLSTRPGRRGRR